jgi:plastocyanin
MSALRPLDRRWFPPARNAALVLAAAVVVFGLAPGLSTAVASADPASGPAEFVNISATSALSFVPDAFTVLPGATVHLVVTQMADFAHTFTLSPAANVTIPSSDSSAQLTAFFQTHPPIVNLSLGSTPGQEFFANFTAPSTLGSYEFVCLIHFPTMFGTMTVATSSASSPASSSPSTIELVALGVVVLLVVVAAVWVIRRRRTRSREGPPPAP